MSEIPTLRELYDELGCRDQTVDGVCWLECNTGADKTAILLHGVTGGKIDMMPLAKRYVNFGYAVYAIDLPGHGGSVRPSLESYEDLGDWFTKVLEQIGRTPDLIVSNSFSSSIIYHALRTGRVPAAAKIVMACPTPDTTHLANMLQRLSNNFPEKPGWYIYNSKPIQNIRTVLALKTRRQEAWRWLRESESYKKDYLTLRDSEILTTMLYEQNPFVEGVPLDSQRRVTVILGGKDNIITSKTPGIIRQLLPETQIISAPSAGHILQFEAVESYPDS